MDGIVIFVNNSADNGGEKVTCTSGKSRHRAVLLQVLCTRVCDHEV